MRVYVDVKIVDDAPSAREAASSLSRQFVVTVDRPFAPNIAWTTASIIEQAVREVEHHYKPLPGYEPLPEDETKGGHDFPF